MTNPLISVTKLRSVMDGPTPPLLLDVRWSLGGPPGIEAYRSGHLPGANFVDLDTELAAPAGSGRGRHPLPGTGAFEAAMRAAGVGDARPVVVYDAGGGLSAARAWWLLRYFGHADTRLMDGGFAAWVAADHPVSSEAPSIAPGDFTARPGSMPVLDARAGERYRGEIEPVDPVAGHIPGARSAPTTANLDAEGRFLPVGVLRERFATLGAAPGAAVGAYCGSGVTAAHEVLALELAGIPAALYVGSWSEWVTDPARPVAMGPEPG